MNSEPSDAAPDLLSVLEAIVRADPGEPGFSGKLAIGLCRADGLRWLLLELAEKQAQCARSDDAAAAVGFDCAWVVGASADPATLLEAGAPALLAGDRSVITRFGDRYLRTRSHLGFQMQRITEARKSAPRMERIRR